MFGRFGGGGGGESETSAALREQCTETRDPLLIHGLICTCMYTQRNKKCFVILNLIIILIKYNYFNFYVLLC
jgi:hypothetical protein